MSQDSNVVSTEENDSVIRLQLDNSVLASLITLSQSIGQLQGEIAVLKAQGFDLEPIKEDIQNLHRIVITGDGLSESLPGQIRRLKDAVDSIKERIKKIEDTLDDMEDNQEDVAVETKKINLQSMWQIVTIIATALVAGVSAWLGLK